MQQLRLSMAMMAMACHAGLISEAQTALSPDSATELLAFSSRRPDKKATASCRQLSARAACASLDIPQTAALGILVCSCTGDSAENVSKSAEKWASRYKLRRLPLSLLGTSWTLNTLDVKLLPTDAGGRESLLAKLLTTPFSLSPADVGSPYRIYVRRKDGKVASTGDLADLKNALGIEAEVETISITRKNKEISK